MTKKKREKMNYNIRNKRGCGVTDDHEEPREHATQVHLTG